MKTYLNSIDRFTVSLSEACIHRRIYIVENKVTVKIKEVLKYVMIKKN